METEKQQKECSFFHSLLPIVVLFGIVTYGLILRPVLLNQTPFPLEIVFILAAVFAIAELIWLGYKWDKILDSIVEKLTKALPAFFILLAIGVLIGSWMISGTIPMLVYYGLKTINPLLLYLIAFWVCVIFSMLTGTSWGSVGSIGAIFIGIAVAMGANLGITAGAIIGGAVFGDKMSPLSDTTNMAALATDVNLFDHIGSMMYTTIPSAVIASILYFGLGFIYPPTILSGGLDTAAPFLLGLETVFSFNILLLLPPLIVLFGSFKRKPTVPTLIISALFAGVLALIFQKFNLSDVLQSLIRGFDVKMAPWAGELTNEVITLLNRGGLYALIDAIVVAFTVFIFIGAMGHVNAIERVVNRVFRFAKTKAGTILASLAATAVTNSLTSNQYATSFIVGDAFKSKYDDLGISRKVLSRSLEDAGTMLESLVPWTPTAVFMVATLGVAYGEYWHWQFLSLVNFIVAPTLAILGIGCFYNESKKSKV